MEKYIIFDFDGTLSINDGVIWQLCWKEFPQEIREKKYNLKFYNLYKNGKIDYDKWMELTCSYFVNSNFKYNNLINVAHQIKLVNGLSEIIHLLKKQGYHLCIVSGGVKQIIEIALGEDKKYFDEIKAHEMYFCPKGNLVSISPTRYDNEGKAKYIEELIRDKNISKENILFVGNSANDEFVHRTGCKTLCVNPDGAHYDNKKVWSDAIVKMNNLNEMLPFIEKMNNQKFLAKSTEITK